MKKILFIITKPETGGAQKVVYSIIRNIYKDYKVTLVYGQGNDLIKWIENFNITTICIPELVREIDFHKDVVALKKLYQIIKTHKFDIVHCHSAKAGALGRLAAKLARVKKIIYTVHGWGSSANLFQSKLKTFILLIVEYILSYYCTDIICVSKSDYLFAKKLGISTKKLDVIYNGILIEEYSENLSLKNELNIKRNEFVVGTVARVTYPKDWKNTLKVAQYLKNKNQNIKFLWVGDGDDFNRFSYYIFKMNLNDIFIPLGNRNDISNILSNLDLFMLLTNWEGLPISIIEALHKSLPIIATDVGGNKELVFENKNGYLIKNNKDIEYIANRIMNIANNKQIYNKFKLHSKKLADKYFTEKTMIKKYKKIYEFNSR